MIQLGHMKTTESQFQRQAMQEKLKRDKSIPQIATKNDEHHTTQLMEKNCFERPTEPLF